MSSIIQQKTLLNEQSVSLTNQLFEKFNIKSELQAIGIKKKRGVSVFNVFKQLFILIFTGKNWYFHQKNTDVTTSFRKDVIYDFLNSIFIQWETLLFSISTQIICYFSQFLAPKRKRVLVADSTLYDRNRSKKAELLTTVYDSVSKKLKKGLQLLVLGWDDGFSFIPLLFRLVSSTKPEKILYPSREITDKTTPAYTRRIDAVKDKLTLLVEMVKQVMKTSIRFSYLLVDSWFATPKFFSQCRNEGIEVITRLKNTSKIYYQFRNRILTLANLFAEVKKRYPSKHDIYYCIVKTNAHKVPLKIIFLRNNRNKNKWIALATTDLQLGNKEIIRLYGRRWDIEVAFKMCKQYLKLAKEFQGRSFDMFVGHTTIVFLKYIMLEYYKRLENDEKTFGDLFFLLSDEVKDLTYSQALKNILMLFVEMVKKQIKIEDNNGLDQLVQDFILKLPASFGVLFGYRLYES